MKIMRIKYKISHARLQQLCIKFVCLNQTQLHRLGNYYVTMHLLFADQAAVIDVATPGCNHDNHRPRHFYSPRLALPCFLPLSSLLALPYLMIFYLSFRFPYDHFTDSRNRAIGKLGLCVLAVQRLIFPLRCSGVPGSPQYCQSLRIGVTYR